MIDGEETYKCYHCRDTGYSRAFHPVSMKEALACVRGECDESRVHIRYCEVPCFCKHQHDVPWKTSGETRAWQQHQMMLRKNKNAQPPIRTDDERVVIVDVLKFIPEQRAALMQWAREYQAKLAERESSRDSKYAVFAEFNAGD